MARLRKGEREEKKGVLLRILRRFRFGIREQELAQELGWERRTINNYLHDLAHENKAYKEGHSWFSE